MGDKRVHRHHLQKADQSNSNGTANKNCPNNLPADQKPQRIKEANTLAKEVTTKEAYDKPDLHIDPKFNLTSAQLSKLMQALAYEGICEQRTIKYKRNLNMVMDITHYVTEEAFGFLPSNKKIWKSTQDKDLPRTFRAFLWKTLHSMHKVGDYWENISNWEHRVICHHCDQNAME